MTTPPTPSQTVGPFFSLGLSNDFGGTDLIHADTPGSIRIEGTVLDGSSDPVPDALVEIWQADGSGRYPPQAGVAWTGYEPEPAFTGFGRCATDPEGHFHFLTVRPGRVAHPSGVMQAPHIAVAVFARGLLKHVVTRLYFPDEAAHNAADPVLATVPDARVPTLIARHQSAAFVFDIRLQGPLETVFFEL
jgi:protocatechuate 3,4-dioxygenase alpha subunit